MIDAVFGARVGLSELNELEGMAFGIAKLERDGTALQGLRASARDDGMRKLTQPLACGPDVGRDKRAMLEQEIVAAAHFGIRPSGRIALREFEGLLAARQNGLSHATRSQ